MYSRWQYVVSSSRHSGERALGLRDRPGVYIYSRISDDITMPDEIPLSEAAVILGVTPRQAQRLAASGELGHVRRVGRTVVVAPTAVYRAQNNGTTSRGRPALPETAWVALDLLSGRPADGPRETRIATRLAAMSPIQIARFTRRRASITHLRGISRMAPNDLIARLRDAGMQPTGLMSPLAVDWGLAGDPATVVDGYLWLGPGAALRDLGLREDPGGRIVLRLLDAPVNALPPAAVALDLMESMDSRARGVGQDRLTRMIGALS